MKNPKVSKKQDNKQPNLDGKGSMRQKSQSKKMEVDQQNTVSNSNSASQSRSRSPHRCAKHSKLKM